MLGLQVAAALGQQFWLLKLCIAFSFGPDVFVFLLSQVRPALFFSFPPWVLSINTRRYRRFVRHSLMWQCDRPSSIQYLTVYSERGSFFT